VQDEASQAAALIPPPRPGETVLDAAAAPGGKSFSLLAWEPTVAVTLADVSLARVEVLRSNVRRLGRERDLPILVADAGTPPFDPERRQFDRVILDLPCTGTGTLRRHPELKWRISEGEIGRLSRQALRLMQGAAPLVAPGGHLVAITCSLEEEENEAVVARFLATDPRFAPLELGGLLENPVASGVLAPGTWRILTGGDHDGFSVNVLKKAHN
jgi:16S rRNA (cytosine967-C5)-methyltransferase